MNPAIDLSTSVDAVAPTRKMRCDDVHRDPGGGGINVARVLRRLGADALAIYLAGGAAGKLLERLVEREAITGLVIDGRHETRENFTVFERESGEQYRFVLPGPQVDEAVLQDTLSAIGGLETGGFLVASGSLPAGVPARFYADVARIASSRELKLVLDSSGAALREGLLGTPFLIKPNLRELGELAGGTLAGEEAARGAAAKLVEEGRVEMVALTLGADGALLA
ncbi:MAG: phosphofructokinase, partial [Alphaproteobacteria bacterium HGW-Alphaproteobacteria-12]